MRVKRFRNKGRRSRGGGGDRGRGGWRRAERMMREALGLDWEVETAFTAAWFVSKYLCDV